MNTDTLNRKNVNIIFVDPRCKINYASFYIYGIRCVFPKAKIKWKCFDDLNISTDEQTRVGFAIKLLFNNTTIYNIYIDYGDWNTIEESYYKWSNIYAKINLRPTDKNREKVIAIGPSFGIKLWNPFKTILLGIYHYRLIKNSSIEFHKTFQQFISSYLYMLLRRKSYNFYHKFGKERNDYVFSLHTLWYDDLTYNTTNMLRGQFIRLCQKNIPIFEGGFYYINSQDVLNEFPKYADYKNRYSDIIIERRISMRKYYNNLSKSLFVFNTPSVCGCHGWKLAEYLCAGKAIISTPLNNLMPDVFLNGREYIEVTSNEELYKAILNLRDNKSRVQELKKHAYDYFNNSLSPESVIKKIVFSLFP